MFCLCKFLLRSSKKKGDCCSFYMILLLFLFLGDNLLEFIFCNMVEQVVL